MAQQPFTPAGVDAKQAELYALSDSQLAGQAALIKSDLRSWVNTNFTLNANQQSYLTNIDNRWITYSGDLLSFVIGNRLKIIFGDPGNPTALKLIRMPNTVTATWDGTNFTAGGTLTIQVVYS